MAVSQSLTVTQTSQSVADNTSKVRILWTSTQSDGSFNNYSSTAKYYVSINGGAEVTYSVTYTLPKNSTTTILDVTITVPHRADGSASVRVRTWMDTDISEGVIERTKTLTLTTIPKATTPTFHATSVDMGGTLTIYLNRASTAFTHDLAYSFAGGSYVTFATGVTTVYYWATPNLAAQIPNATSGTVTVRCTTKNGGAVVGTKTATFTLKVPTTDAYAPQIHGVAIAEATEGLADYFGAFIQGHSTLAVTVNASAANGATIKSYSTTLDGLTYSGASFTSSALMNAGTLNLVTTVTDSRGRTARHTTTIEVLEYYTPWITNFHAYRVDASGNAKNDGRYIKVTYSYQVAFMDHRNAATAMIHYKRASATDWGSPLLTLTSLSASATRQFSIVFSTDYQYDIRLTVTDWFGEKAEYIVTIPTANVILDIKAEGDGLSFGKTSEYAGFEVDMPAAGESFKMVGVRSYEIGTGYGHVLYNNGLLLQWGSVSITPTALNTVTSMVAMFPIPYVTRPHITGTLVANSPQVVSWSMGVGTTEEAAVSSLVIYMTRSTMHATPFRWMAVGLADMTSAAAMEVT